MTCAPDEVNERPVCRLCDADRDAGLCDDCYGRRKTWRAPDEVNEPECRMCFNSGIAWLDHSPCPCGRAPDEVNGGK